MNPIPLHIAPVLARAVGAFRAKYGCEPTWRAAAPGRVNLIGEHTDYNGGFVLPIAIDRVCVAVGGPAADPAISRVFSVDLDQSGGFDALKPLRVRNPGTDVAMGVERGTWISYIAGVFAQFQSRHGSADPRPLANLDMAIASSVPVGSGLSSSASIEVATATLLEQATASRLDPTPKALLCQRAEHEFAGVPCGIMDQFISVMGRENHALLIDCRSQEGTLIPMPDQAVIVVMNTNIRHALAGGEYAARRATCAAAAAKLGVRELRDSDIRTLDAARQALSAEELRCARHVLTENSRTLAAADALRAGDLARFGRLMRESHASLRDDYRVSCAELDTLVELAMAAPGVFGARMTGGGFGGCAIALVKAGVGAEFSSAISTGYRRSHGRDCGVSFVRASSGAEALSA